MRKALFINLPHKEQITRRYMCSYVSPESLLPPFELIALAAIARESYFLEVKLIDAIAERLSSEKVISQAKNFNPDIIVSILGLECIEEDCAEIANLKTCFPDIKIIVFGHYVTQFAEDILRKSQADYAILGEPDFIFSNLLSALTGNIKLEDVNGIVVKKSDNEFIKQGDDERIPNPNELPQPAYDLLPKDAYYEPMLPRPYGLIQTARGCPYPCSFCVKSYGQKLTIQSPERIVAEIQFLIKTQSIKSLRFIDDTFTVNKRRVIEICKRLIEQKIKLKWCCLSRTDNLTEEMLYWMKKSGCVRVYFGLESGSQRILDLYQKNMDINEAIEILHLCRKYGIETVGFFMSGYPEETEEDFGQTISFARNANLNFASINPLTPYPGTALFERLREDVEFSIFPYKNDFKDKNLAETFADRKKHFYKSFYFQPIYWLRNGVFFLNNFQETFAYAKGLFTYLFLNGGFVISGLKGRKDK